MVSARSTSDVIALNNAMAWQQANFRELSSISAFSIDDPVESVDYDRVKNRLAVSSHHGKIKMYDVDKNGKWPLYVPSQVAIIFWQASWP